MERLWHNAEYKISMIYSSPLLEPWDNWYLKFILKNIIWTSLGFLHKNTVNLRFWLEWDICCNKKYLWIIIINYYFLVDEALSSNSPLSVLEKQFCPEADILLTLWG